MGEPAAATPPPPLLSLEKKKLLRSKGLEETWLFLTAIQQHSCICVTDGETLPLLRVDSFPLSLTLVLATATILHMIHCHIFPHI